MNRYEEKQAARKARLEERADRLASEASATYRSAKQMADAIPFGQPILVGHHSEKRDRNYRDRYGRKFDKSIELHKAAEATARRAEGVGMGGISSDDPDAIVKLRTKLANLESNQQAAAAINKAWRKVGEPDPDNLEAWTHIADLVGRNINDLAGLRLEIAKTYRSCPYHGTVPFKPYELTGYSAEARRIKARIAQLKYRAEVAAETPAVERMVGEVRVVENFEDNRLQLFFPGKPDAATRGTLKGVGFRWAPSEGCWQAHLSANAKWRACAVLGAEWEQVA